MNRGDSITLPDHPPVVTRTPQAVVAQLLSASAPSKAVSVLVLAARLVAAVGACGWMVVLVNWGRAAHGKTIAEALSVSTKSPTMEALVIAIVAFGSVLLSFLVFRIGARRWIKVGPW